MAEFSAPTRLAEVGARFPESDVAMVPIGANAPRWFIRPVHMDPKEAVLAAVNLGARRMVVMHWGTFLAETAAPARARPGRRPAAAPRTFGSS